MIPVTDEYFSAISDEFEYIRQPSYTYELDIASGRILSSYIDGIDAVRQACYVILETERFANIIYSDYYGAELHSLFGVPETIVNTELERRVREALMRDDRVLDVYNFTITRERDTRHLTCDVDSIYGDFSVGIEVNI